MNTIRFRPNVHLEPHAIADLQEAVGRERRDEDYPTALKHYRATMSGIDAEGMLIAWCAILSDSVRHAVLLDVIVHPEWQRQGIGLALVN
jgi:GNAT superfamily N-acetyltransferase